MLTVLVIIARSSAIGLVLEALFGNGVIPAFGKRITAQNAPYSQNKADKKATFHKCLKGIGRTGWCKPAAGRFYGRYKFSIKLY